MAEDNAAQPLTFHPDANDVSALPVWVKSPAQTTDGHLVQLASANGAVLATLDEGIPGDVSDSVRDFAATGSGRTSE